MPPRHAVAALAEGDLIPSRRRAIIATSAVRQITGFHESDFASTVTVSPRALTRILKVLAAARDRTSKKLYGMEQRIRLTTSAQTVSLVARTNAAELRVEMPGDIVGGLDTFVPWETLERLSQSPDPIVFGERAAESGRTRETWGRFPLRLWHPNGEADMDLVWDEPAAVLDADALAAYLRVLRMAAAPPNDPPALQGIAVNPQDRWCVATNGSRLVRTPLPGPIKGPAHIVARGGVSAILAVLGPRPRGQATWQVSSCWAICRYGSTTIAAALIPLPYPDIRRALPEGYAEEATVDGRTLAHALKTLRRAIGDDRLTNIHMDWLANGLRLSLGNTDAPVPGPLHVPGTGKLPGGASVSATFYPRSLTSLDTLRAGPVRCQYSAPNMPVLFTQTHIEHLIQPLRTR